MTLYFWILVKYEWFKRESIFQKRFFFIELAAADLTALRCGCNKRVELDLCKFEVSCLLDGDGRIWVDVRAGGEE